MLNMDRWSLAERPGLLKLAVERVERYFGERFPVSDGFRHKTETSTPFREQAFIVAYRVKVQRGWLWGYSLQLTPADKEHKGVRTWFGPSSRLLDSVAKLAGWVFAFGTLGGMLLVFLVSVVSNSGGSAGGVALAGALIGGLLAAVVGLPAWLVSRFLMARCRSAEDREQEASLKRDLSSLVWADRDGEPTC